MSTNYKETNVTGSSYVRASNINIANPRIGEKVISFYEEKVLNIGDEVITQGMGMPISQVFNEDTYTEAFPVLDPSTGQPNGQVIQFHELYAILFSLYMYVANKRDIQAQINTELNTGI